MKLKEGRGLGVEWGGWGWGDSTHKNQDTFHNRIHKLHVQGNIYKSLVMSIVIQLINVNHY